MGFKRVTVVSLSVAFIATSCGQADDVGGIDPAPSSNVEQADVDIRVSAGEPSEAPGDSPASPGSLEAGSGQPDAALLNQIENSPFASRVDLLGELSSIHERMLKDGLPLLRVSISGVVATGSPSDAISYRLIPTAVLWAPAAFTAGLPDPVDVVIAEPLKTEAAMFSDLGDAEEALAVVEGDKVVALAVLNPDGSLRRPTAAAGPLFLAESLAEMAERPAAYFRGPRSCTPAEDAVPPVNETTAPHDRLTTFLEFHDDVPVSRTREDSISAWAEADRLEGLAPNQLDPVSGMYVGPDINDLYVQLMAGVPPESVVASPVVTGVIDMRGFSLGRVGEYLILFEAATGRLLSYFTLTEVGQVFSDGTEVAFDDVIVEILSPKDGLDVAIAFRPPGSDAPIVGCPVLDSPHLVVPHDQVAGDSRLVISAGDRAAVGRDAEYLTSIINGPVVDR